MEKNRRSLYLYPITKHTFREGGNNYIQNLVIALSHEFNIVNNQTSWGLLDVLLKIPKTNIIYLNWIEDIAGKRWAVMQAILLYFIIIISKLLQVKIVWFIHNNLSHFKQNLWLKKIIVTVLARHADVILSHSKAITLKIPPEKHYSFDHPIENFTPVKAIKKPEYDLLIWGRIEPHKGVDDFIKYNYKSDSLLNYKILIAGKFHSQEYYNSLQKFILPNIKIDNRIISEPELMLYLENSKYVLFTYNSPSVLSSAALCKTLSYGKTIIGPDRGSFKELGRKGLIYNYREYNDLKSLLVKLENKNNPVDITKLKLYIEATSWINFTDFLTTTLKSVFKDKVSVVESSLITSYSTELSENK